MTDIANEDLEALIDGRLDAEALHAIVTTSRSEDRFRRVLAILQQRSGWSERILLALSDHLFIVLKEDERIVRCSCGHEFGDWRGNWKLGALILVRDTRDALEEIYPGMSAPDPRLGEVREYICPGCGVLLDVEAVPRGYPVIFDALPDLDAFYRDWLGDPLPVEREFCDRSLEVITRWRDAVDGF